MKLIDAYPYLYETHLHTKEASACARSTGEDMICACKKAGYTGVFVTNHNWYGNTCVDRRLPWTEWVDTFCDAFETSKKCGDEIGIDVFFGYESGYRGTEFLIYGVDRDWLKNHPQIKDASVEEQYQLIHGAGGMVIHAHPFREEPYIPEIRLYPAYVDGVEMVNATHSNHRSISHNDPLFDKKAIAYALEHSFPGTAGSDVHSKELFGGGIAFRRKIKDANDYCRAILSGEDYILTNGDMWLDKRGVKL